MRSHWPADDEGQIYGYNGGAALHSTVVLGGGGGRCQRALQLECNGHLDAIVLKRSNGNDTIRQSKRNTWRRVQTDALRDRKATGIAASGPPCHRREVRALTATETTTTSRCCESTTSFVGSPDQTDYGTFHHDRPTVVVAGRCRKTQWWSRRTNARLWQRAARNHTAHTHAHLSG